MNELSESEFLPRLRRAAEEGLLLFVKYALVVGLFLFVLNYFTTIHRAALNGEQAAIAIMELQKKGWLPQFNNGTIPEKVNEATTQPSVNSTSK